MTRRLIISYTYKPLASPRAFRWSALAERWAADGIDVDVITASRPGLLPEESIEGVRVYRVGGTLVDRLRSQLKKPDPHIDRGLEPAAAGEGSPKGGGTLVARVASVLHHGIWKHIWWPDSSCLWQRAAARKAKRLLAAHRCDAIVTSSPSFSAHLAGYRLKKANPATTWLVDIGDPFCFAEDAVPNNRRLYGKWNYTFERRVFQNADNVAVTTQQTADQYAALFPESAGSINVVPPLVPETPETGGKRTIFPDDGRIRLVFAGSLYRHIRRPEFLLGLFRRLLGTPIGERLELHFFGNTQHCRESFAPYADLLDKRLFVHGLVDRSTALRALGEGDVLVNISNNTRYQLPSKVVEYAGTGKPVINIAQIENDSSAAIFADYPSALCLLDQKGSPTQAQLAQTESFLQALPASLPHDVVDSFTAPYRIEAIAGRYEDLLTGRAP